MQKTLQILMAQTNFLVGAIIENTNKIIDIIHAHQKNHDLIIFPELALTGYPPEDLLFREDFYQAVEKALEEIRKEVGDCHVLIGHPAKERENCYNAATVFYQSKRIALCHKQFLPNSGVFDERRYFVTSSPKPCIFTIQDQVFGVCICEDLWQKGPIEALKKAGAKTILCINASPFDYEKNAIRQNLLKEHAKTGLAIFYINQIGGQDELVFDGLSVAVDAKGNICAQAPAFEEKLLSVRLTGEKIQGEIAEIPEPIAMIYQALLCGLKDYVNKNKFPGVLIGLSGGIDSALTLALAVDALGTDRVQAISMPSRYTSELSKFDAKLQAETQKVQYLELSIEPAFESLLHTLSPVFPEEPHDVTEENIQARIRGLLLMALSNKQGKMVLATSNKSETAVGYATLYGDMVGGFAPLKDVLKTQVYALARYKNRLDPVIPETVLTRPPSAELRKEQTDQDTLPDYNTLDAIIKGFMENNESVQTLINKGFDPDTVALVIHYITRNEYKRRQSAPGIKISPRAFGRDWRYPITRGFWSSANG